MAGEYSLAILALLMLAAWRDIATRTIPDAISFMIVVGGTLTRIINGPSALALSAGTALALFVVLLLAHARGYIGGGDVKIMTALAVGLSPLDSYRFVVATAVAGGLLAVIYIVLSHKTRHMHGTKRTSLLGRIAEVEFWRIRRHGPLPYGVAIAAGGAFVLLHPGSF